MNVKRCAECACVAVTRNPVTVRMLGLCPLLAVTQTCGQSITCGVLFGVIVVTSGLVAALLRDTVSWRLRPMYHGLLAASTTACVIASAQLLNYAAVAALGIYPALIAGNCFVLSHIQETAERRSLRESVVSGCRDVTAIVVFLAAFGALREWLAYGHVFGNAASALDGPLPIFASAPGALLLLALVLAGTNLAERERNTTTALPVDALKPVSDQPITEGGSIRG